MATMINCGHPRDVAFVYSNYKRARDTRIWPYILAALESILPFDTPSSNESDLMRIPNSIKRRIREKLGLQNPCSITLPAFRNYEFPYVRIAKGSRNYKTTVIPLLYYPE